MALNRKTLDRLFVVAAVVLLPSAACPLADADDYPDCTPERVSAGISCTERGGKQTPSQPGLAERGECGRSRNRLGAFIVDNLDYSSLAYIQACDAPAKPLDESFVKPIVSDFANMLATNNFVVNSFADNAGGRSVSQSDFTDIEAVDWRNSSYDPRFNPIESGGQDHVASDAFNLVVIAGHGRSALNQGDFSRREVQLARTLPNPLNGRRYCDVVSIDSRFFGPTQTWYPVFDTMLGAGQGGTTSMVVWATSCSLNDNTWAEAVVRNRVGQEFGFERSPDLTEPAMLRLWLEDSAELSNQEAWIVEGIKVMAALESISIHSGPVATAMGATRAEAEDLFQNASLGLSCRVEQKLAAASQFAPFIRWRKGQSPCTANSRCGRPIYCSANPDGGFPEGVGKNGQPLVSSPSRGQAPSGQMMRAPLSIPNPTNLDVATQAIVIANSLVPNPATPFNLSAVEAMIASNRVSGSWKLNHMGSGLLVGYKASRAQLRIVNRDVTDTIVAGGQPLDIGPQEAYDRALEVASLAGLQLLNLTPEQTGAADPTFNIILDGSGVLGSEPRVFAYVFSMFRTVNGVPVLDLENTLAIHRSGQLYYTDITTAALGTTGQPGIETPVGGGLWTVPFGPSAYREIFSGEFSSRYNETYKADIVWSGFVYAVPRPGASKIEPMFMVEFVPYTADGDVGRMKRWAYSVAEPACGIHIDMPHIFLGEAAQ